MNERGVQRTVWVYEEDLTIRWTNADNPEDILEVTLHAIGTNDGGPDKAKGSALTYCLKYYLFEKFGIDQGEDDPGHEKPSREQRRLSRHSHRLKIRAQRLRTARRVEIPSRQGNPPQTGTQGLRNRSPTPSSPVCTGRARSVGYTQQQIDEPDPAEIQDNKIPTSVTGAV